MMGIFIDLLRQMGSLIALSTSFAKKWRWTFHLFLATSCLASQTMPMEATWDRFPPLDEYKLIPHAAQDAQLHMHNLQFPPDLVPDDQGHQGDTPDEDGNEVLNDYPQLQDPTRFPGDRTFIFWRPDPFNVQRPDPFGSGGPAVAQEDYPICFGKLQDAFQRKPQEWTEWKAT